jgi:hypothetical protein
MKNRHFCQYSIKGSYTCSTVSNILSLPTAGGGGAKESRRSSRTGVWFANSSAISRHDSAWPSFTHQWEHIFSISARRAGVTVSISRINGEAAVKKKQTFYQYANTITKNELMVLPWSIVSCPFFACKNFIANTERSYTNIMMENYLYYILSMGLCNLKWKYMWPLQLVAFSSLQVKAMCHDYTVTITKHYILGQQSYPLYIPKGLSKNWNMVCHDQSSENDSQLIF